MEVLLTGGNSKFGAVLAEQMRQQGWNVETVPRLHLDEEIQVSKEHYDLIFFNHNKPVFDWNFDKYPSQLLKKVTADRIGWMITSAAIYPELDDAPGPQFWSYVAQKMIYINQMKLYRVKSNTFCFDPGIITPDNQESIAIELMNACVENLSKIYKSVSGSGL